MVQVFFFVVHIPDHTAVDISLGGGDAQYVGK
jgi:hypothetical protein